MRNNVVQGQANPQQLARFREVTHQNVIYADSVNFSSWDSPPKQITAPRSAWLGRLYLSWYGTLTTDHTASGNWPSYVESPWNLSRRVRLGSNTQTNIIYCSLWGLGLINGVQRGFDKWPWSDATSLNSDYAAGAYGTGNKNSCFLPAAAAGAAVTIDHTYNVAGCVELPVMTDDALMLGMLLVSSDEVTLTCEIEGPASADVLGTIALSHVTPNITFELTSEVYDIPPVAHVAPNSEYAHIIREDFQGITNTGENLYKFLAGNTLIQAIFQLENNSLPMIFSDIQKADMRYAKTVTPYREPYRSHLNRHGRQLGGILPNGVTLFDGARGSGIPGFLEPRDFLNTAETSDLEFIHEINSTTSLTSARLRAITRQLAPIGG